MGPGPIGGIQLKERKGSVGHHFFGELEAAVAQHIRDTNQVYTQVWMHF
ncbi:hypothetical protein HanIR_Chr09g0394701 [Helianthus annuus]|nr:hypothetical protein HanIR_Chr09g0394701 [Helianthus annuus]